MVTGPNQCDQMAALISPNFPICNNENVSNSIEKLQISSNILENIKLTLKQLPKTFKM